jgi:DNA-binding SARP family transcriptional activator
LSVSLLGSLELKLDDQPVTHLAKGKARALLAYLVVEADRAHRRETLAGLLWPDWAERSARTNLRNALSNLRKAIGDRDADPPFLLVDRETIQFNAESDCWVDVWAFGELTSARDATPDQLESAMALYRGPFLEGFSVADSPTFEDWALVVRERLERQALEALQSLTAHHEGRGEHARARQYALRRIELAPWQEQAHRDLMRLLALSGQRGAALAQYEACRRALREELDVEPGEETRHLYERIRDRALAPPKQEEDVGAITVSRKTQISPNDPPRIISNLLSVVLSSRMALTQRGRRGRVHLQRVPVLVFHCSAVVSVS